MIHLICNNADLKQDGIGDYAYNLCKALQKKCDVTLHTTVSGLNGKWEQLTSVKMSRLICRVATVLKAGDVVFIEYPFVECNPVVVAACRKLRAVADRKDCQILLSLHEYKRVSSLRKFIIRQILKMSDAVMVTDSSLIPWIAEKYMKPARLRTIPSNIFGGSVRECKKDRSLYVFFGLISRTKAFREMLEAWQRFNKGKRNTLLIMTSSDFDNTFEQYGVRFLHNLTQQEIAEHFRKAAYCILPIIPHVSINNATYKTALLYECIPIGHFDPQLASLEYIVNIKENSTDGILDGLIESAEMDEVEYSSKASVLRLVEKPSFEQTASEYINAVNNLLVNHL